MVVDEAIAVEDDDEEPTDSGPAVLIHCMPCRGSGELVAQFSPGGASRWSCVACRGTGIMRLRISKA
jgi:hypothetical protein